MSLAFAPVIGVLALFGLPLFAVFGAITALYFGVLDQDVELMMRNIYGQFTRSPTLVSVPLFTFAGYLMAESRTGERLVRLFQAWFGWLPGGLAVVCLLACAFFTTFTGASGVTIIAIGGLLFPVLIKQKYPERFSLGLITASGSLGLLFPPALPLIIYGIIAGADIPRLFVAGILPGILLILVLGGYAVFVAKRAKVPRQPFKAKEAWESLRGSFWEAILPVVIFALIYSGAIAISETAVVVAAYVLIIEVFVYRDLKLGGDVPRVVRQSMVLVGAIFAILAVAIAFTDCLIIDEIPNKIFNFINQYISSPWAFLILLNVFLLIVGCMMDIFSAIVVVVPLIIPVAAKFGIDPTHLGIIFLANLEIGYLTPPVGINLFLSAMRFNRPVIEMYRVAVPFLLLLLVALAIITYIPKLSLALPDAFGMRSRAAEAMKEMNRGAKPIDLGEDPDDAELKDMPAKPKATPKAKPKPVEGAPELGGGGATILDDEGDGGAKKPAQDEEGGPELGGGGATILEEEGDGGAKKKSVADEEGGPELGGGGATILDDEDDDKKKPAGADAKKKPGKKKSAEEDDDLAEPEEDAVLK